MSGASLGCLSGYQMIVQFYASARPTDGTGGIVFSGCPSIFLPINASMQRHR